MTLPRGHEYLPFLQSYQWTQGSVPIVPSRCFTLSESLLAEADQVWRKGESVWRHYPQCNVDSTRTTGPGMWTFRTEIPAPSVHAFGYDFQAMVTLPEPQIATLGHLEVNPQYIYLQTRLLALPDPAFGERLREHGYEREK